MVLAELRISLGRYRGYLLVADEVSPDTCKFWSIDNEENLDRDVYNYEKGKVENIYQKIVNQIGIGSY